MRLEMTLVDELRRCGFTPSVAWTIASSGRIKTVEELGGEPWLDAPGRPGLMARLLKLRNSNNRLIAQVEAFRLHGDAKVRASGEIKVAVRLDSGLAARLDDWIAFQPKPLGRPDAIKAILDLRLQRLGAPCPEPPGDT